MRVARSGDASSPICLADPHAHLWHVSSFCLLGLLWLIMCAIAPRHGTDQTHPVNRHVISALRNVFFGRLLVYICGWVLFRTSISCPQTLTGHSLDLLESLLFTVSVPWDGPGVGQQPDRCNEMTSSRKVYHLSQTKGALMKPICV